MFDPRVDAHELAEYRGIFDRSNPENPFKDFSVIVVPYCTGDVHIGDASRRYGDDPSSRPVAHRGYRNVAAVLGWLAEQKRTLLRVYESLRAEARAHAAAPVTASEAVAEVVDRQHAGGRGKGTAR